MSISSQSQEAITAIDAELEAILQKRRDVTNSNKEEVTEQEELQAGTQSVEGDETESEAETDTEIAPDDDEAKDNTVSRKRKGGDDSSEPLAKSHTLNLLKRPHLQRTKSLEAISHNPPTKVIKVCLEKAQQLLEPTSQSPKDYKKVKYWLKIALSVSQSIEREEEFFEFIKQLRTEHERDTQLREMLDTTFPLATMKMEAS